MIQDEAYLLSDDEVVSTFSVSSFSRLRRKSADADPISTLCLTARGVSLLFSASTASIAACRLIAISF